jgi:hypothetical protein
MSCGCHGLQPIADPCMRSTPYSDGLDSSFLYFRGNGKKKQQDRRDNHKLSVDLTYQDVHDLLLRLGRYTLKLRWSELPGNFPF